MLFRDLDNIYFEIPSHDVESELGRKLDCIYELYIQNNGIENQLKMLAKVCELTAILYSKCKKRKSVIPINDQKDSERARIIITYLNEHYNEKLLQQELAKKFHFSRGYFCRFFKIQTGMTFKEYITSFRMQKAIDELVNTNNKILDIAWNNGFTSETQFISNFKKFFQITPSVYRKQNRYKTSDKIDIKQIHFK